MAKTYEVLKRNISPENLAYLKEKLGVDYLSDNSKLKKKSDKEEFSEINPPNPFPTPEDYDAVIEGEEAWERQREEEAFQHHQGNWDRSKW